MSKNLKNKGQPDVKYGNYTLGRMVRKIMKEGKRQVADKIMYQAIDMVMESEIGKTFEHVNDMVTAVISKSRPSVEVVSKRIKGATYPVPSEVNARRGEMLSIRWILEGSRKKGRGMAPALAEEMKSILSDKPCFTSQKIMELKSSVKANRAYGHFSGAGKK